MAGLTSTGFQRKLLAEIKEEIETSLRAVFGDSINLIAPSVFATLVGVIAEREASEWDLAEEVYNSQYPDTAEGTSLDDLAALTGITRLSATKSTVLSQLLFGDAGTVVPLGTIFSVLGNPTAKFLTDAAATLGVGVDEIQNLAFSATPDAGSFKLKWNDQETSLIGFGSGASQVQTALNGLAGLSGVLVTGSFAAGFVITFAGADGKQNQPTLVVTSNTLTNTLVPVTTTVTTPTSGVPQATVNLTAQNTGPTQAPAGTLTAIDTPVAGLNSTKNQSDASVGRALETDIELRARREQTLQVSGAATVDAIRSELLALEGVTDVVVFENTSFVTDIDAVPAKSYEVVIAGGDPVEIAQKIWDTKPAGIYTHGSVIGSPVDSMGLTQQVRFSRPTSLDIYVEVDLTVNGNFPVDGLAEVEQAILDYGAALRVGQDVLAFEIICAIAHITGIVDIALRMGIAPSPTTDDNIQVTNRQIASFDSSRIEVEEV